VDRASTSVVHEKRACLDPCFEARQSVEDEGGVWDQSWSTANGAGSGRGKAIPTAERVAGRANASSPAATRPRFNCKDVCGGD
jgi:hypothetical protein